MKLWLRILLLRGIDPKAISLAVVEMDHQSSFPFGFDVAALLAAVLHDFLNAHFSSVEGGMEDTLKN